MNGFSRYLPFLASAGVFALDRVTKQVIRTHVSAWDNLSVIPGVLQHRAHRKSRRGVRVIRRFE